MNNLFRAIPGRQNYMNAFKFYHCWKGKQRENFARCFHSFLQVVKKGLLSAENLPYRREGTTAD